ncbi:glycerol-3-phosphate dehydrogenase [Sphingobium mellinum]|uniref:glycerol-3-phosphate dehydrogenase n=1 Tax=Sphingobium mellinum TaxID=1387166 RepID=UPI0030EBDD50
MSGNELSATYDLLIVGGGINGAGIARDAAGRGLSVLLVEQDDLAGHTSSASTKLIHGGLRYLEYGEFRLVRESLMERERLWRMAPHIIRPLRFVLPQTRSPRPAWMVRLGLFLYDHLGGRRALPATQTIALDRSPLGSGLANRRGKGFVYSDCWVEDSRLVVLNAMDAAERGADIRTRTRLVRARRDGDRWRAEIVDHSGTTEVRASILVNAGGPWVAEVIRAAGLARERGVRLVKGSHIVVPRLYDGDHAFMLQNADRRIVFAIPYEGRFTLIGTTDQPWAGAPAKVGIDATETAYLLDTVNRYFVQQIGSGDIVWSYAGIRPLYDDQAGNPSAVTRDYMLDLDKEGAPLLSVFGGKITTYRRLAEHALDLLGTGSAWTAGAVLPGGDMTSGDFDAFLDRLIAGRPGMPPTLLRRLARAYGTRAGRLLGNAQCLDDLGPLLAGDLSAAEVDYLVSQEWARTSEDILYRRSKLGLHLAGEAAARIDEYLDASSSLSAPLRKGR